MDRLEEAGYGIIAGLQTFRTAWLDPLAHGVSFLGDELFYLILLPGLYWVASRALALRLTVLFLLSIWLNEVLKAALDLPRPSPERVAVLELRETGGVPSGHAQGSLTVWGYLWARAGTPAGGHRWRLLGAVAVLLFLIGISRLYLGAHFPHDLLSGWLVGLVVLLAFLAAAPRVEAWLEAAPTWVWILLAVGVPLFLLVALSPEEGVPPAAALLGAGAGAVWERRRIRFGVKGPWGRRIVRLALGLAVAFGIWAGLAGVLAPLGDPGRALRYALLGFWVTGGAPWVFVRASLASREDA